MSKYIASIDQGTTSTRCILFDRTGPVVTAQKEHAQLFPQPGWVEHDPMEIWQRTSEVIGDSIRLASARPQDIAAVAITNQRETTVLWDKRTGRPLAPAVVWQDTRTKTICDRMSADAGINGGIDRFRPLTGLPLATYFSAPKIQWLLDNIPNARSLADAGHILFGTIDTWLIWWLTGGPSTGRHLTDPTNASRTMLMNLATLDWDDSLLRAFKIPRQVLPTIAPSSHPTAFGATSPTGPFAAAIPITGILGDQQAALVGQCCFSPGQSKNTYGTGCFMLLNTGEKIIHSQSGLLTTVAYQFSSSALSTHHSALCYALEGSIAVTGSLIQWLRDNLGLIAASKDIEPLARSAGDNGGVYIVPAFSGLFAPYWRSDARGIICGLTRHSNKSHIARAALEATAYQTRDVLEAMRKDAHLDLTDLQVDGGMSVNNLLMQFQSDILNIPVTRPKVLETTAQGAAYAAGLAVGFWKDINDLKQNWQPAQTWRPTMNHENSEKLYTNWKKAVERAMGWETP